MFKVHIKHYDRKENKIPREEDEKNGQLYISGLSALKHASELADKECSLLNKIYKSTNKFYCVQDEEERTVMVRDDKRVTVYQVVRVENSGEDSGEKKDDKSGE